MQSKILKLRKREMERKRMKERKRKFKTTIMGPVILRFFLVKLSP